MQHFELMLVFSCTRLVHKFPDSKSGNLCVSKGHLDTHIEFDKDQGSFEINLLSGKTSCQQKAHFQETLWSKPQLFFFLVLI